MSKPTAPAAKSAPSAKGDAKAPKEATPPRKYVILEVEIETGKAKKTDFEAKSDSGAIKKAAQLTGAPSLGGEMALTGAQLPDEHSRDGKLRIGVRWAVQQPTTEARTFSVRLVDGQGLAWSQADNIAYLSEQWHRGDVGWQWWDLRFDPSLPAGPYKVQLALTDANRQPLPVTDANGAAHPQPVLFVFVHHHDPVLPRDPHEPPDAVVGEFGRNQHRRDLARQPHGEARPGDVAHGVGAATEAVHRERAQQGIEPVDRKSVV